MVDETNKGSQDSLSGQASDAKGGNTPSSPRTYTEEEKNKAISDALAEQGRKHKLELDPVITERNTLRDQSRTLNKSLEAITEEREELKTQLAELSKTDPARFDLLSKERDLKNRERKLKDELAEVENNRTTLQERYKKVELYERNENIRAVVADYDGVTAEKLTALCDRLNITSLEQIKAAAETLGTKKEPAASTTTTKKPDSTETSGGMDYKTIRDAYNANPNDPETRRKYLEARRKRTS